MATSSNQLAAPYCSSSTSSSSANCWDVFLSFYGEDTRKNFTSHLYSALDRAGILTFMDDPELKKGEEISRGLLNAIHGSKLQIVVLSKNYAFSRWCLDELVEILTSKRTSGHEVIPVFYYVDPSDLWHLKGSFKDALDVQKERYSVETVEKWASALAEIAGLSGYHLKSDANENESDTVQEIVDYLTPLISPKDLHLEEYLVGIDSSVEEIYRKLCMESNDVRAIGICGMGGIGKTTTAKAFYNKYFNKFDVSCFVEDVKQQSQGGSYLLPLLQQLSVKLLGRTDDKVHDVKSGMRQLKQFLCNKKALIVVDDLNQSTCSELLVRVCNLFSAGSRIIFTTRDAYLAKQLKEDVSEVDIYMMRELDQVDSLELFSYHAFRKPTPPESFKELSVSFIAYARGLPLALKVLGSFLFGRTDVSFWKGNLEKVKKFGENGIQQILRLSYDELGDDTLKDIFLDIAFFFVGRDRDEAVHIFQSCDFFPEVGIPVLVERCLLTITLDNKFQMHSLIQDMGKKVIREESKRGNCRHLYLCGVDACMALQNLEGSAYNIEGLIIKQTMSTKRYFNAKIFEKLPKLRLLEIIGAHDIKGNFDNSFYELRCFRWHHCPWIRLPSSFCPQKLVSLDMPFSEFKTAWNVAKPLVNLKTINLSHSRNLKSMPDFTNLQSVEKLVFRGCKSLLQVHPSIGRLTNLSHLDLGGCDHLKKLTEAIGQLTKLRHLDLGRCVNLKRLPEAVIQLTTLGTLNLGNCHNLTRLPEQLGDMKCLKMLNASHTSIEQLPNSIGYLKELVQLRLYGCKKLRKLPAPIGNMESLELFDASYTSIEQLPDSIGYLKELVQLRLFGCNKLQKLPEQIGNMESLKVFNASSSAIEHLPDTFGGLISLKELNLSCCKNLTSLPNTLWKLKVLRVLNLAWCSKLEQLPEQLGKMQCLESLDACGTAVEELPDSIGLLSTLRELDLDWCKKVRNLPSSIWNLTSLAELSLQQEDMVKIDLPDMVKDMKLKSLRMTCDVSLCLPVILSLSSLERLYLDCESQSFSPNEPYSLSKLSNLQELTLYNKISHECSFPELPLNLTTLRIYDYETLEMLPDLSSLKQLKILSLCRCISLQSIPPLPPHLEELYINECTSLQDLPDLSTLKELRRLVLRDCMNLKSNSLKQSFLQVGQHKLHSFSADKFPELPPNLKELSIIEYKTVEMLPDLSSLKQLKSLSLTRCISLQSIPPLPTHLERLDIDECTGLQDLPDLSSLKQLKMLTLERCISLQSIPPLPPHLEELDLYECTSLQDLPDLSTLKELWRFQISDCMNLKSNSLKQSFLQVGQHKLDSFSAVNIPNKEVGEWFSYKSSGNTLSFTIPPNPNSGDNFFFGLGLWIVYNRPQRIENVRAVITNRTKDIKMEYPIFVLFEKVVVGEAQGIECITREYLSMESGDRIKISLSSGIVKKCGAHVIWRKHC